MIQSLLLINCGISLLLFLPINAAAEAEASEADPTLALYEKAFDLLDLDLTESEQNALYGESDAEMSEESRKKIREGLEVLSQATAAERVSWPQEETEADELFSSEIFNYLGPARNAARIGIWHAKEIGKEDPDAAIEVLKSTLALARHLNDDGMLIQLLTSLAIEGITYSALENLAGDWEKRHRERLLEIIATEAPEYSVEKAVARESEHVLSRMHNTLYSIPEAASLSELLRISSVVLLPGETWLAIEHLGLELTFRLKPGEIRHGVELVSFDPERDQAVVRADGKEAVVRLESRKIESLNLPAFFKLLGLQADGNLARRLVEKEIWFDIPDLSNSLTGNESDAEVALLFVKEFQTTYELLAELLAKPFGELETDWNREAEITFPEGTTAFAESLASNFARVRRTAQGGKTRREMVITALRLLDDPDTEIPTDAFSPDGKPLSTTINEDAIVLESRLERSGRSIQTFRIER